MQAKPLVAGVPELPVPPELLPVPELEPPELEVSSSPAPSSSLEHATIASVPPANARRASHLFMAASLARSPL